MSTANKIDLSTLTSDELNILIETARNRRTELWQEEQAKQEEAREKERQDKLAKLDSKEFREFQKAVKAAATEFEKGFSEESEFDFNLQVESNTGIGEDYADVDWFYVNTDDYNEVTLDVTSKFTGEKADTLSAEVRDMIYDDSDMRKALVAADGLENEVEKANQEILTLVEKLRKKLEAGRGSKNAKIHVKFNAEVQVEDPSIIYNHNYEYPFDNHNDEMYNFVYTVKLTSDDLTKDQLKQLQESANARLDGACIQGMQFAPAGLKKIAKNVVTFNKLGKKALDTYGLGLEEIV